MPTTRALLDDLATAGHRGTFMVVGWIAEHFPGLVREIRDAGHEIGLHGHWHRRVYELSPDAFRQDLRLNIAALSAAGAGPDRLVPGAGMVAEPARAVGAADPRRGRNAHRRQPRASGARRVAFVPARPHPIATAAGALLEVPPLVGHLAGHAVPLGWGWGLRKAEPATVVERHRGEQPAGRPGRPYCASMGDRSRAPVRPPAGAPRVLPLLPAVRLPRAAARGAGWRGVRSPVRASGRQGMAARLIGATLLAGLLARRRGGGPGRGAATAASRVRVDGARAHAAPGSAGGRSARRRCHRSGRRCRTRRCHVGLARLAHDRGRRRRIGRRRRRGRIACARIVAAVPTLAAVELQADGLEPRRTAFLLKMAAAEIRARSAAVPIVLGGAAAARCGRDAVVTADVAPSIDGLRHCQAMRTRWRVRRMDRRPRSRRVAGELDARRPRDAARHVRSWRTTSRPRPPGHHTGLSPVGRRVARRPACRGSVAATCMPATSRRSAIAEGALVVACRWRRRDRRRAAGGCSTTSPRWAPTGRSTPMSAREDRLDVSLVVPSSGAVVVRDPLTGRDRPALRTTSRRCSAADGGDAWCCLGRGRGSWTSIAAPKAGFIQREDVTAARSAVGGGDPGASPGARRRPSASVRLGT